MSDVRIFTIEEAEATLPLVRRIVADLTATFPAWREAVSRYEVLAAGDSADSGESDAARLARDEVTELARSINSYLEELDAVGCLFKGFDSGLVDFYALREDRLVFLCWSLEEERIEHWHELDRGYAGRQPIDARHFSGRAP